MKKLLCVLAVLVSVGSIARAERPPQQREKADVVLVGRIAKLTGKDSAWGGDGISTSYKAKVVVQKVEKGGGMKEGDTVEVNWYAVTKTPSKLLPGAYGHEYDVKKDTVATFWLMGTASKGFTVIYNPNGVEKVKK